MTRYVSEGSIERTAKQGVWGVEDLRKRPAPPGGTSELPWARAQKTYASAVQSIANHTNITVVFTEYVNMAAGESGEGFSSDAPTNQDLIPPSDGLYLVKLCVIWDVTNVGKFRFGLSKNIGLIEWFYGDTNHTPDGDLEFFATSQQYAVGTNVAWSIVLHHDAGAARNLDAAYIHATRIGDVTGDEWNAMSPDHT